MDDFAQKKQTMVRLREDLPQLHDWEVRGRKKHPSSLRDWQVLKYHQMFFKLQQLEGSWWYCCFLPGTGVFGQAEGGPGASHEEYNRPEQKRDLRQGTRVPEQKAAAHERWVAKEEKKGGKQML